MRLVKYLAHSGVASRRASERLIASGRVTVGGEVVTDPARDVGPPDAVAVDGRAVAPEPREVWMLNKPVGRGLDRLRARPPPRRRRPGRLRPPPLSGGPPRRRLDRPDPARQRRRAREPADPSALSRCRRSTRSRCVEPRTTSSCGACAKASSSRTARPPGQSPPRIGARDLEITISEGRNRQIRRMVERVGNRVASPCVGSASVRCAWRVCPRVGAGCSGARSCGGSGRMPGRWTQSPTPPASARERVGARLRRARRRAGGGQRPRARSSPPPIELLRELMERNEPRAERR